MITKPASSLPSLRQPHGDHRDVRGGSRTSPSPLRAGAPHRDEYVMMPPTVTIIAPSPAGFSRPRWRTAVTPFPHTIWYAITKPFAQSTPSRRRRGAVSPQLLAPLSLARTRAARSLQAKSPLAPPDRGAHSPAVSFPGGFRTPARPPSRVWRAP